MRKTMTLIMVMLFCFSTLVGCGMKTESNTKASAQIINLADDTVKSLKERLKTPSSLHINSVVVNEISGASTVLGQNTEENNTSEKAYTYSVYIDYSADNSIGENEQAYFSASYFVSGDDLKTVDTPHEISSIPQLSGTVYEISTSDLKSYSDTLK